MPRLVRWILVLLAPLALACDRTAELIPGSGSEASPTPPPASATPGAPLLAPASLRLAAGEDAAEAEAEAPAEADLARSVVQIRVVDGSRTPPTVRDGSGVVIGGDPALILTSALLLAPWDDGGEPVYDTILVATNPAPGGEPRLSHEASLAAYDPVSELAVLRVEGRLPAAGEDGEGADEGGADGAANTGGPLLGAPAAAVGDSAALKRGDGVRLFGHPGLNPSGAATPQGVMVAEASLTGVRADPATGEAAWLTTGVLLPHGAAGGPAFNAAGELVGVSAQIAYSASAPVAFVRPIALAAALIEEARAGGGAMRPPLAHSHPAPGTPLRGAGDGIAIGAPLFASEALDEDGARALFDYARVFPAGVTELHYEFAAQGIPDGATVQELWYLDGVFQDDLSAAYNWDLGPLHLVSDRLASLNPAGPPDGVWRLEVWVDGQLRAASQAYLGVAPPSMRVTSIEFGEGVSATFAPTALPSSGAERVFAIFGYADAANAGRMRWRVYRDGELRYVSPVAPWRGGDRGACWVGLQTPDGLAAGDWEFEIEVDGEIVARDGFTLS